METADSIFATQIIIVVSITALVMVILVFGAVIDSASSRGRAKAIDEIKERTCKIRLTSYRLNEKTGCIEFVDTQGIFTGIA